MSRPPKPLDNVLVVEMGSVVLAPYASQVLADMGATVIKVEPPGGDNTRQLGIVRHPGMGSLFLNCNRGKQSIAIDLKRPEGLEVLRRLLARADVLLHNMRADAAGRLGLGYEQCAALNERLIYCASYGYSAKGRYAARPAYDDIIQAACGVASLRGRIDGKPAYAPTIIADKTTALFAVVGIMGALMRRGITGRGENIEVAMFETMVHYLSIEHLNGLTYDPPAGRSGYARLLNDYRRPHRTRDGFLAVLPYTEPQWRAFFAAAECPGVLEDPRFATNAGRTRHIDALYEIVSQVLPMRTNAEWIALLLEHDIPHSAVNELEDLIDDPHLADVGFWQRTPHPTEGTLVAPSFPVRYGGPEGDATSAALPPQLGEHTAAIMADSGYSAAQIAALIAAGVVIAHQAAASAAPAAVAAA